MANEKYHNENRLALVLDESYPLSMSFHLLEKYHFRWLFHGTSLSPSYAASWEFPSLNQRLNFRKGKIKNLLHIDRHSHGRR